MLSIEPLHKEYNSNPLNIVIAQSDLKLKDLDLYLKLWLKYKEKEYIKNIEELKNEITLQINIARERNLCKGCDGYGLVNGQKCIAIGCFGRGYLD